MKLALIGATGLVGTEIIKVLEEFQLTVSQFIPVASSKSVGRTISFNGSIHQVVDIETALELKPQIVIYSAGSQISVDTAEKFTANGAWVIDNSSAWRMFDYVPLVVPEVNLHTINNNTRIIANPNCSTIQLVAAIYPLHKKNRIRKLIVSTYQAVSGTGSAAVKQLMSEREGIQHEKVYPYQIDLNLLPHAGAFLDNKYTSEEIKLVKETQKIIGDSEIDIYPTVVRVPVTVGHSESVYMEFENPMSVQKAHEILSVAKGIIVQDNPEMNLYPMPMLSEGKDEVFVGRIRGGFHCDNVLQMWIVADNLRKGAATNAVQIARYISDSFINPKS